MTSFLQEESRSLGAKRWALRWMLALVAIPVSSQKGWQNLSFSKIPANAVTFSDRGLQVEVNGSASPLIYPFKEKLLISSVTLKGQVNRLIDFKGKRQGDEGFDDYVLRLGLVIPGQQTLNWAQRQLAAAWVLKLFSLAPAGAGIDHIYFLNLGQTPGDRGRMRQHPLSELIKEKNEWVMTEPGQFQLTAAFDRPKEAAALWISIDGDDTKAKFTTQLELIELQAETSPGATTKGATSTSEN